MTITLADGFEPTIRTGACALNLLVAVQLARVRPVRLATVAGCLFALGTPSYALVSYPWPAGTLGLASEALVLATVLNPVFFWWFGLALFRDRFEWRPVHGLPVLILVGLHGVRFAWDGAVRDAAVPRSTPSTCRSSWR